MPPPGPMTPKLSSDGVIRGSGPGEPLDADPVRRMNTITRAFLQNEHVDQTSNAPEPGRENYS